MLNSQLSSLQLTDPDDIIEKKQKQIQPSIDNI